MDERKAFGARLTAIREEKKLSQKQLAALADITENNLSRIENGLYDPTTKTLFKISTALNKKLSFID